MSPDLAAGDPLVTTVVGLYLLGMVALGVWAARRRIADADDYIVAGRRLPWFLLAATLAATEVGAGSSMGVVQKAYGAWGLGAAWYIWAMAVTFALFAFVAPALTRTRCRTVPHYFHMRYGAGACAICALLMIVALVGLTAVQVIATGVVITVILGWSGRAAALVGGVVVTGYTYAGGMWSVALTDFVQWFFIVGGLTTAVPFSVRRAGGLSRVWRDAPVGSWTAVLSLGFGEIAALLAIYVSGFFVGQETLQRLYSARDERHARWGALTTAAFYALFGAIPPLLGLVARSLVAQGVLASGEIERIGDHAILPLLASVSLPPLLAAILFAGLISATMSSADSNLLGAAAIWANDLLPLVRRGGVDDAATMRHTRSAVLVVGVTATLVAMLELRDLIDMLKLSFSLRAAGAFFPFLLGHYWSRSSKAGALLSLVGASSVIGACGLSGARPLGLDPVFSGLAAGLVLHLLGSLLWRGATESDPESKPPTAA